MFFPMTMDWFKGKFTGKPHLQWENLWFPVDFPVKTNPLTMTIAGAVIRRCCVRASCSDGREAARRKMLQVKQSKHAGLMVV